MTYCPPQHVRIVEDLDGYLRVYDTADWSVVFTDVRDAAGQPLSTVDSTLTMQLRPQNLPNRIVDTLEIGAGITLTPDAAGLAGPSVSLTSYAQNRTWNAREETTVIGDLMMQIGQATVFLTRIHFLVTPGVTRL